MARDITAACRFNGRERIEDLEDGNYRTFWTSHRREGAHCLLVSAPEAVGGVLVRWRNPAPLAAQVKSRVLRFSRAHPVPEGAFAQEGKVMVRFGGEDKYLCDAAEIRIPGPHNLENALAAVLSLIHI